MIDFEERYENWKAKRRGKITSSILPNLMKSAKEKDAEFGQQALKELMFVKYERRTRTTRESISGRSLDWGSNNESAAIQWLRSQFMNDIRSCSDDFEQIVFNEPFEGFGDSPDFYLYDFNGQIEAIGEIKCPTDQSKIEELRGLTEITEKQEYYWQFLGHFVGTPEAKKMLFVVYDGYVNDGTIVELYRADHEANIAKLEARIKRAHAYVNELLATEQ